MSPLRIVRIATWALVALLVGATGWLVWQGGAGKPVVVATGEPALGGPFTLQDASGRPVTEKDLAGRAHAIFFGFTHCPDVCPTTLSEMTVLLEDLGPASADLDVYFVTVDPERDTAPVLESYLGSFSGRIRGLTGTPEQVAAVTAAYKVFSRKVPTDGGDYTMDHTASVFLFDAAGRFAGALSYGEPHDTRLAKLKALVGA